MKRGVLIVLGWICIALGTAGIFLPLLPTTVFILLASWCFARSSERFHNWLHNHNKLGPMIKSWETGQGIPQRTKYRAILIVWLSICLSIYLIHFRIWLTCLLLLVALSVSIYLYRLPNAKINNG